MHRFAFRFNVSTHVGVGHFRRCNEIALALKALGHDSMAILDESSALPEYDTHHFSAIEVVNKKFDAQQSANYCIKHNISALLVDHYHCDQNYQKMFNKHEIPFGQFDYFCRGHYLGHFIININPAAHQQWYSQCKLANNIRLLLGSKYTVLSHKIPVAIPQNKLSDTSSIFVSLGGGNDHGLYQQILPLLLSVNSNLSIHVCAPSNCDSAHYLQQLAAINHNVKTHLDVENIYHVMQQCHGAIVSSGTLTFELASLGIPFACGYLAENQEKLCQSWQQAYNMVNLGDLHHLRESVINTAIQTLNGQGESVKQHLKAAYDKQGAKRLAQRLIEIGQ